MESETKDKIELQDKLANFYKSNKIKIFITISVFIVILIVFTFFKINFEKKNNFIAENYIKAGIYLVSGEKEKSKIIYDEIIYSNNKFYAILALNTILEKDLINEKNKIIEYFNLVEDLNLSNDQKDLLSFKKALYFIKSKQIKEGKNILEDLIKKNSKLKSLAEEVISE
ncbi:hypothetical protein OAR49_00010 [Pelagibacteraceae bacterium]|nr:hypothetical protein [Pelagibacteraceae bacterium]